MGHSFDFLKKKSTHHKPKERAATESEIVTLANLLRQHAKSVAHPVSASHIHIADHISKLTKDCAIDAFWKAGILLALSPPLELSTENLELRSEILDKAKKLEQLELKLERSAIMIDTYKEECNKRGLCVHMPTEPKPDVTS